jgi:peptidoglycan/LPS O-acetylase OafA/YrhL
MRNKRLDVLRCIAVLLVLVCHRVNPTRLEAAGRVGVDLFFVLSGFLISGLLFVEYKRSGSIDFKRFFIRRGLKIYPAFYFFLLITLLYQILFHQVAPLGRYLSEIFYVQNYGSLIWGHTWSLAVEEHFYILLPLFFLLLIRYSSHRTDPFHAMPRAFLAVAATCLALRVVTVLSTTSAELQIGKGYRWASFTTHCRLDALFFGVLLGYLYHFRPVVLDKLFDSPKKQFISAALSGALLSCCLIFPLEGRLMVTLGLTMLYLGFGLALILCLRVREVLPGPLAKQCNRIGTGLAYVGMYSYSVYLWHLPFESWGFSFMTRILHVQMGRVVGLLFYMTGSIVLGIFLSQLIEFPILKLRDRIFPAMQAGALRGPRPQGQVEPGPGPRLSVETPLGASASPKENPHC